jgi:cytochrome oxidase assembly protein ShyY1
MGALIAQQIIVPDRPNTQLGAFPTVMIPTFAVPSSIILHVLSLWQLRRLARKPAEIRL